VKNMKEKIKRNFSKSASKYDAYASLHKEIAGRVLSQIPEDDYKYILDIGTGTGFLAYGLAESFKKAKVFAVDLAPGMIEHARAKNPYPNIQFQEGDGEKIPFGNDTFDLVVSSSSFQWMDPKKCFFEVKRVLKPEGDFVFSFFGPKTLQELKGIVGDKSFYKYPGAKELKKLFEKLGFKSVGLISEVKKDVFPDFMTMLRFLKGLGAQTGRDGSKKPLRLAEVEYNKKCSCKGGIRATFEIVYGGMSK